MAFLKTARASCLGLLGNDIECTVDDALGGGLLAVQEDLVDQLGDEAVVVNSIRLNLAAVLLAARRGI